MSANVSGSTTQETSLWFQRRWNAGGTHFTNMNALSSQHLMEEKVAAMAKAVGLQIDKISTVCFECRSQCSPLTTCFCEAFIGTACIAQHAKVCHPPYICI